MPSKDWEAWIDEMGGKERALYVTGFVEVDDTRFGAKLEPDLPGDEPAIRRLRYEIYEQSAAGNPFIHYKQVDEYREPTQEKYTHVEIQPDGELVEVKIVTGETDS